MTFAEVTQNQIAFRIHPPSEFFLGGDGSRWLVAVSQYFVCSVPGTPHLGPRVSECFSVYAWTLPLFLSDFLLKGHIHLLNLCYFAAGGVGFVFYPSDVPPFLIRRER